MEDAIPPRRKRRGILAGNRMKKLIKVNKYKAKQRLASREEQEKRERYVKRRKYQEDKLMDLAVKKTFQELEFRENSLIIDGPSGVLNGLS
jgi:hypothetical protein